MFADRRKINIFAENNTEQYKNKKHETMLLNIPILLDATTPRGDNFTFPLILVLMFVVMYFFMIRPQQKKQKEIREMRKKLDKGDKVITQGGIYGTIIGVSENYFMVEIDNNVKIKVGRDFVFKDIADATQVNR